MKFRGHTKRALLAALIATSTAGIANAATWLPAPTGNWSTATNWSTDPTIPDGMGETIDYAGPLSALVVDGTPRTVGNITLGSGATGTWTITPTAVLTLNQNGATAGNALITNDSSNALIFGAGTLTLNDNATYSNTNITPTGVGGAIQLGSAINGTGNLVLRSDAPIVTPTTASAVGSIRVTGTNTFSGNTIIEKGLVTFANVSAFGDVASKTITLGGAGANSTALIWNNAAATGTTVNIAQTVENNIIIPAGNTGTVTLGGVNNAIVAFGGTIAADSDLTLYSTGTAASTALFIMNPISGSAGVTKDGPGFMQMFNGFVNPININTYAGNTVINAGTFVAASVGAIPDGAGKGNVIINANGTLQIAQVAGTNQEVVNGLSGTGILTAATAGSTTANFRLTVGNNNVSSTFDGNMINNGSRTIGLNKEGSGTQKLNGTNSGTGLFLVNAGTLQFGKRVSLYNATTASWIGDNVRVITGATAAFNVGGTGEFTAADIAILQAMTSVTAPLTRGFGAGSFIGLDTTNAAGGNFTYTTPIVNTNGGTNVVGLKKLGDNTLTLTGANTYTGSTSVIGGTLQFANQGSLYNNVSGNWTSANLTVDDGAVAAFNVGGVGEFTTTDIDTIRTNIIATSTATTGFRNGSSIGFDTTGGDFTYAGSIADAGPTNANRIGLTKLGPNSLTLSGANTFTGALNWIRGGTLNLTGSHNAGAGAYIVGFEATENATVNISGDLTFNHTGPTDYAIEIGSFGTGVITQTAGTVTTGGAAGLVAIGDVTGSGTYNLKGGTLDVAAGSVGAIFAGPGTANFNFTGGTLKVKQFNPNTIGGNFVGGGLTQSNTDGASLLDVTGNSTTITGAYTLNSGSVDIGASQSLTVTGGLNNVGGTIKGNGTIIGNITSSGILSVGNSIGQMDVTGDATVADIWDIEYDGIANTIDRLDVTGQLTLTGSTLNFIDFASDLPESSALILASYGSLVGTGTISGVLPAGYSVDYNYNNNNQIALINAIPEPGTYLLAGMGLVGLAFIRKRRMK